ncbi:MAG: hypothetical protein LRY54_01435, partial [Alphaproteobacteria bacterium]|nr:hypothetical protein [Alphaproteobacteria bacterium]
MSSLVRFFLVGTVFFASALPAFAEGPLSVRTGDHTDYSRIVFEWKKLEGYKVERQGDTLLVSFVEGATPPAEKVEAFNILKMDVISSNPFSAKISIPPGTEYRAFSAGERVIIDVYDSVNRHRPAQAPSEPAKDGEHGAADTAKEEEKTGGHGAPSEESKKPSDEPELGKIIKPDTVPVKSLPDDKHDAQAMFKDAGAVEKPKDSALKAPVHTPADSAETSHDTAVKPKAAHSDTSGFVPKPNLINVSSTQPVGLAAFESGGQILIALDVPGVLVKPQVSGENSAMIEPVNSFSVEKGEGFSAHALSGTKLRAEGGGLLWSIVITPETEGLENAPIERKDGHVFVPLKNIRGVLDVIDPQTGAFLQVVTVSDSESRVGDARSFVDFDILASAAGLAVRPKADGVEVKIVSEGVEISKPGGLILSDAADIARAEKALQAAQQKPKEAPKPQLENGQVLFDFKEWRMGGLDMLNQNRNIVFTDMHDKTKDEQIADLIQLARMHIANGRAAEALGFLRFAGQEIPELEQNPEFLALRAISKAFDGKLETALEDLSSPVLADYTEAKIWKAYVLASLGDWAQAKETLPDDLTILKNYTPEVLNRLALVLAEIELRDGNLEIAEELFALVEKDKAEDDLNKSINAQLEYLKGEAARQKGKIDDAIKLWEPLTSGLDDLYRVKAGLALTRLLVDNKKLDPAQAIDRLERLRYAWRGDELEAQVNYWLGRTYFEAGETIKGL